MINLLLGSPGSGKSYEATAFHIIPELQKGRRVITNLPLLVDEIAAFDHSIDLAELLVIKDKMLPRSFSTMADYADSWRHPKTGSGPLYVIDEAHFALPRGRTDQKVVGWYAMHRHESADVLLISQSHSKIDRDICDLVQICYRVRKNTAFGHQGSYVRKVKDGLRGQVVNTNVRRYNPIYFGLYKSHTMNGGQELATQDVRPIWKHWTFICSGAIFLFLALWFLVAGNPFSRMFKPKSLEASQPQAKKASNDKAPSSPPMALPVSLPQPPQISIPKIPRVEHPYLGYDFKLVGCSSSSSRTVCVVSLSANGMRVADVTQGELSDAGYSFKWVNSCLAIIRYGSESFNAVCDGPRIVSAPMVAATRSVEKAKMESSKQQAPTPLPPLPAAVPSNVSIASSRGSF